MMSDSAARFSMAGKFVFVMTVLMFICHSGCSYQQAPATTKVTGVITYQSKPISGCKLVFESETGWNSHAEVNAVGEFILKSNQREGAVPGQYQVRIVNGSADASLKIPPEYYESGMIKVTIEANKDNFLKIELPLSTTKNMKQIVVTNS